MPLKAALLRPLVRRRTFAKEPALIPIYSSCGLSRDVCGVAVDHERWVTKRVYVKTHGVNLAACYLTHTYCPGCFKDFMDRLRPRPSSLGMGQ